MSILSLPHVMDIPAMFAVADGGTIQTVKIPGGRCIPSKDDIRVPFESTVSSLPQTTVREPAVVVDWKSISSRKFGEKVLKNMRVRGRDIWFMTWIECVGDVMDAFNTTADHVLAPLHAIPDKEELEDIYSVSDGVIPIIFVKGGKTSVFGRSIEVRDALDMLEGCGFYRTSVLDTDDSMTREDWERIYDMFPSCIPFISETNKVDGLFMNRIVPHRG